MNFLPSIIKRTRFRRQVLSEPVSVHGFLRLAFYIGRIKMRCRDLGIQHLNKLWHLEAFAYQEYITSEQDAELDALFTPEQVEELYGTYCNCLE